jgi:hypothetical protein
VVVVIAMESQVEIDLGMPTDKACNSRLLHTFYTPLARPSSKLIYGCLQTKHVTELTEPRHEKGFE